MPSKLKNTIDMVKLNLKYDKLAIDKKSVQAEIGMLYIRIGRKFGFGDTEMTDLVKRVVVLSQEIKEVAKQLKLQEEVDFSQVGGENPVMEKFNQIMLRITTSSEKMALRARYDDLVEKGIDLLAQLGHLVMAAKNRSMEALQEYQNARSRYEVLLTEFLKTAKEVKDSSNLYQDRSEFLIPLLTLIFSTKDYFIEKQRKKNKNKNIDDKTSANTSANTDKN